VTDFDAGYGDEPFATLCRSYPGPETYPPRDFRVEWGPVFHRGRLDGSARVLVMGQDPGPHEVITRRILVGEAGQRVQGFLAKLGISRSYVMVNAFLYSVYGQRGGDRHRTNPDIAAYRNRWLDALLVDSGVEAVITLGRLARTAFEQWKATPAGAASAITHRAVIHPTYPESASAGGQTTKAAATAQLLDGWNQALADLRPRLTHPDHDPDPAPYGPALTDDDLAPIPAADLPPGLPAWMRALDPWAVRTGRTAHEKRATITVAVPPPFRDWP
jgi:uracil-DNA glycosylase